MQVMDKIRSVGFAGFDCYANGFHVDSLNAGMCPAPMPWCSFCMRTTENEKYFICDSLFI